MRLTSKMSGYNYTTEVKNLTIPANHTHIVVNGTTTYFGPSKNLKQEQQPQIPYDMGFFSETKKKSSEKIRAGEKFGDKKEYNFGGWKIRFLSNNKIYTIIPPNSDNEDYVIRKDSSETFDNNHFSFDEVKINDTTYVKKGIVLETPKKKKVPEKISIDKPNQLNMSNSKRFGAKSEYNFGGWKIRFLDSETYTVDSPPGSGVNMHDEIIHIRGYSACNDVIFSPQKISIHEIIYVRNGIVLDTPEEDKFDLRSITKNFFSRKN